MKFEIIYKNVTKIIDIDTNIDFDMLFKYKEANVYHIPYGSKKSRDFVSIGTNEINISGPNGLKYEKSGIDSVKITNYIDYKKASETDYEDRKKTTTTQYTDKGYIDCIIYFSNGDRFKKEVYENTKKLKYVEYFDSFGMLILTLFKDEILFPSRRKNLKYFVDHTSDQAIKMTKITEYVMVGLQDYDRIMKDIKENRNIFV